MRIRFVAAAPAGAALLFSLVGAAAHGQGLRVLRPAHNAIVREEVAFRVAPNDVPSGGYVSVSLDGNFKIAQVLPPKSGAPVYVWDTKATDANGQSVVKDGNHTVTLILYTSNSKEVGRDTIPLRVANQISPPAQGLKLTYHWSTQRRLIYQRTSEMVVPGSQAVTADTSGSGVTVAPPPDEYLQSSDLAFVRSAAPTASKSLVRDLIRTGIVSDHGQTQSILKTYNIRPRQRTVNARGVVLAGESNSDFMDHIGFPIPELPVRRVGKGDSWLSPAIVALNWDGSSMANVTTECRLEGFEWQNNYPTAKIRETYNGPITFTSRPASAFGRPSLPLIRSGAVNYDRVLYFAYGSGRLIKSVATAQITLTPIQLAELGGTVPTLGFAGGGYSGLGGYPGGLGGYPGGGYPGGGYPGGGYPGGGYPGGGYPGGGGGGYPGGGGGGYPGSQDGAYTGGAQVRLISDGATPQYAQYGGGYPGQTVAKTSAVLKVSETTTLQRP